MQSKATVTVTCGQASRHTIHSYLFGHFVEDIRDHMEAMLAYPLKDMDFESEAAGTPGVSGSWHAYTNGKNTAYALEAAAPRHSGRAQRIRLLSGDEAYAGIAQRTALKGVKHALRLTARASIELSYLIVEAVDRSNGERLGLERIELNGHNWRLYEADLPVSRDCADAELRLYVPAEHPRWRDHVSTGMLWIDHVSLLPADHVGSVKREVVEMSRALNAGMMRLSGNYISAYHFEHGIGPVLERPVMFNEAWGGWTSKYFGTDEFIAFCRELRVEPLICVNDGSGSPEEAAQWVEYCNGGADTPMGAKRAANGHPEPYDVKYWEIGNEVWGPWQVGTVTAEAFARRTLSFIDAMKRSDPSLIILACGHTDQDWNRTVLDIAGEHIDYLTLHLYHGYNRFGMDSHTPAEERYKAIASFPEWTRHNFGQTAREIGSHPKHAHVKLAITEYNTMYYPNTMRKGLPDEHTLGAAVANAANLNEMLRASERVHIGSFSDLVNGWLGGCIRVGDAYADQYCGKLPGWSGRPLCVYGTPTYEVMKLYAGRELSRLLPVQTDCGTFSVQPNIPVPIPLDALPDLDAVACANESGDTVTVLVVNRSLSEVKTGFRLDGWEAAGTVRLHEITGESEWDINSVFAPERIACHTRTLPAEVWSEGCVLRPASVYALEFRAEAAAKGGGEQ